METIYNVVIGLPTNVWSRLIR